MEDIRVNKLTLLHYSYIFELIQDSRKTSGIGLYELHYTYMKEMKKTSSEGI